MIYGMLFSLMMYQSQVLILFANFPLYFEFPYKFYARMLTGAYAANGNNLQNEPLDYMQSLNERKN